MSKSIKKVIPMLLCAVLILAITGCKDNKKSNTPVNEPTQSPVVSIQDIDALAVRFGYDGEAFEMTLDKNITTQTLAAALDSKPLNLPIYHYDDFENWEVMQYYDIPARYEIPTEPTEISSEKAGEVYIDENNRVILFYHDAQIPGNYTRIGVFDATDEFISAVENNPVVEGWSNKIISISK